MEQTERAVRLQRLISAYQPELLRVCYFYLRDRMLAEDAVQETFVRVWRKLDSYHEVGREKAWLYRIAINCCRDTQRTGWFRRMLPVGAPQLFPQESVTVSEEAIALNMAIHDLPLRLKEVILLHYYQNFTLTEIAEILAISQPAVSDRLKRARRRLCDALREDIFDEA
ncbi:MAG: sigma-70 family RNA polymerase sigma factor [Clostridiales bacterium]|nr:sigma-70 family RNA polymerase sigma factor [Clostridiales bacterium]